MNIVIYDMGRLRDEDEYAARYEAASKYRQDNADRINYKARSIENIAAAAVLDDALKPYGLREKSIEYEYGPQGKPYIKGRDIYFNISHSGDYAVCAVSRKEIGIDIQKIGKIRCELAKHYYTREENELIMSAPNDVERADIFYRIWTVKESFVKAIGCGIAMPFNLFNVSLYPNVKVTYNWDDIEKYIGGRFGTKASFRVKEIECDMEDYCMAVTEVDYE